ncbi:MAG TPA: MoxR family ATPase [Terriglobales bacterium]|nr:MoxR family ATPase [Terriglobales bacterium]
MPATQGFPSGVVDQDVDAIVTGFERLGYVADRSLATAIFLVIKLRKPILVEGHAGLGKTEIAKVLAAFLDTRLIRLQCYEGLDVSSAVYEWNYQKQLLAIKIEERSKQTVEEKERHIFSREFLLERPLLESILAEDASPVLLIDEIDRADEAFEAFLLELLSDYQITIPEMGTVHAKHVPYVVLTSNRNRELGDALKRRCLYQWIDYPSLAKEMKIVRTRLPKIEEQLARQVVGYVQAVRGLNLSKPPGVAETLDCAEALLTLGKSQVDEASIEHTLGCISKSVEDGAKIRSAGLEKVLEPPRRG